MLDLDHFAAIDLVEPNSFEADSYALFQPQS